MIEHFNIDPFFFFLIGCVYFGSLRVTFALVKSPRMMMRGSGWFYFSPCLLSGLVSQEHTPEVGCKHRSESMKGTPSLKTFLTCPC